MKLNFSLLMLVSVFIQAGGNLIYPMMAGAQGHSPIMVAKSDESEFELGKIDASSSSTSGPLSKEQLEQLLDKRLPATMGMSFYRFTNMYLVPSQAKSGQAIALETTSDKIGKTVLRSPFPAFYRPTLRQFLDEIAWQTKSKWKYDSDEKSTKSKEKENPGVKQLALFDFTEADRALPFELNMAKDWTARDNGNWTMYSPSGSPVSLDVYELGTYTAQDKAVEPEMLRKVPQELALEWAKRVQPRAKQSDLTRSKVGPFEALFFETKVKSQAKQDVHWRQWVFMDGKQCYFIVSTIFPESESKLLPEVEGMLKSFHIRP